MNCHKYTNNIITRRSKPAGFTLVELMAATGITAAIVVVLVMVSAEATRAWTRGHAAMESAQSARIIFDLMNRDLRSLFVGNGVTITALDRSTLNFWALAPTPRGTRDLCRIRYYVAGNKLFREVEYISSNAGSPTTTTITASELASNVWRSPTSVGLEFAYYLPDNTSITALPASGYIVPSRIFVTLTLQTPYSLKSGVTLTAQSGSHTTVYETSFFVPSGLR